MAGLWRIPVAPVEDLAHAAGECIREVVGAVPVQLEVEIAVEVEATAGPR